MMMNRRESLLVGLSALVATAVPWRPRAVNPQSDRYRWTFTTRKVPRWLFDVTGRFCCGWMVTAINWSAPVNGSITVTIDWYRSERFVRVVDVNTKRSRRLFVYQNVGCLQFIRLAWTALWCKREPLTPPMVDVNHA